MDARSLLTIITTIITYGCFRWYIPIGVSNDCTVSDSVASVFDTCPLVLFNHMAPELLKYYHPDFNPKEVRDSS
ncbi:hypothetical protein ANCCAN_12098 [Ancylostoma caninum]|uniref:Uncharacterized protein n=1 Tax=Ancylostoma caninum TaxID=29170 RepID=A0A368GE66_ANCCA|nr:hypothetical protein ANCCAN_12098 [Ancylostoma caninum]